MSELNIKIRKLQDNGSTFRATPESLYMGGVGSAKVDTLCFDVPEEWKGCAITLHVQRLSGTLPDPQLLDEKNRAVVDQRWTKEKQGLWMLMAVGADGYTAMTKPGWYTCYETIDRDSTTETITPSVYEQFVALVKKETAEANRAAKNAAASAEIAKRFESTITATGEQVQREITATADQTKKDLTATADQTKQAIDEKAKVALASIPEDYTALSESVGQVKEDKVDKPSVADNNKTPRAKNGEVEWVDVGQPTDEQTNNAVTNWLNEHPEATTTVQNGSITEEKIKNDFLLHIKNDYITPEMFGAKGDGLTDDSEAFQKAVNAGDYIFISGNTYLISKTVNVNKNTTFIGIKNQTTLKTDETTIFNISAGAVNFENITFDSNTVSYNYNKNTERVYPFTYYNFTYRNATAIGVYSESTSPCKFFNCRFLRLYMGISALNNTECHDCRFTYCILAFECRSFDPFFWNCYFTACEQGIIMSNRNYNTMFIYSCWFDQIGEHAIGTINTSVGGYINATFDQIGGSAICGITLNRLKVEGRFSRCGTKYAHAQPDEKTFYNGEYSAAIHAENAANQLCVHASFVDTPLKDETIEVKPVILSVRNGYKMFLSGFMDTDNKYVAINKANTGLLIDGSNVYKISGTNLVEAFTV